MFAELLTMEGVSQPWMMIMIAVIAFVFVLKILSDQQAEIKVLQNSSKHYVNYNTLTQLQNRSAKTILEKIRSAVRRSRGNPDAMEQEIEKEINVIEASFGADDPQQIDPLSQELLADE